MCVVYLDYSVSKCIDNISAKTEYLFFLDHTLYCNIRHTKGFALISESRVATREVTAVRSPGTAERVAPTCCN